MMRGNLFFQTLLELIDLYLEYARNSLSNQKAKNTDTEIRKS